VLEYMDDDAFSLLKTKRLPRAEAKGVLKATVRTLAARHEKDIVHTGASQGTICLHSGYRGLGFSAGRPLDIKPDNILVSKALRVHCTNSAISATLLRQTCPPTMEGT
jgi:serine/threonine protein kinase